ncbi:MAG TPA: GMC family oxidoreductase N-terminal domain-containing protein [Candidatus Dormibacteraeota bacterium]|nr:GMC family oxidoreductase N-terminal domain-containing protein [Candidatus Dormibacteraeota bacterium]
MSLTAARRATLAALADTLLPHGGTLEPGASDVNVAGQLDSYLDRCAPGTRRTVNLMLTAFNLSSLASRHARPFRRLGTAAREAYVVDCETSKIRQRRETLIALRALILMFFCSDDRIKPLIGYDGLPYKKVERDPGIVELVIEQPDQSFYEAADVVVVGSGAGGAVAAKELAEAGLKVIVLEEGEHFDRRHFTGSPPERLRQFYRGNGLTFTIGVPTISLPIGRGVGGSTLINSGTCFRTPGFVLDAWGIDGAELEPLFDGIEKTLNVGPVGEDIMGTNGEVMERGRRELGYSGGPIRRNARGCHGSGVCAFGCPLDAKLGMHVSYLPLAAQAGARIMTGCRVDGVVVENGRAVGVRGSILDPETGAVHRDGRFEVSAPHVVLAAGAIYTPALLLRQRIANSSRQVGRNLRIHPGCGVLGVFDHDLYAWKGVMQSYYVDEKLRDGILLEATYPPPGVGYSAGGVGGKGSDVKEVLARYRQTAAAGLIISDTGTGRVRVTPGGAFLITYDMHPDDVRKTLEGIRLATDIYLAAGAQEVHTLLPGMPAVRKREELSSITEGKWTAADLKLSAYHPMGTCRMGKDARTSVVDEFGLAHDLPGLAIMDASVLPGSTYVNPQITIMALATRSARHLAAQLS